MLGDCGHQRGGGGVGIFAAEQINRAIATDQLDDVGSRPADRGDAPTADLGLEEQAHRLLHGGHGVPDGVGAAVQRTGQQSVPEPGGVRVLLQDLGGLLSGDRVGDPFQDVFQTPAGQRRRVQEPLQDLRGLSGVEAGGAVLPSAGHRAGDRPGGEGLRAFLGDLRVDATGDGVPHELGQPWGGPERVEHRDRTRQPTTSPSTCTLTGTGSSASLAERALPPAGGEEQVIEFRQGRHRRSWVGKQRRGQHVQGLARALLTEHPGGAVIRAPQLDAARDRRSAQAPADVGRLERHLAPFLVPWGRCRSGRMIALVDRSRLKPRTCSASARVAIPRRASAGRW